ncbi:hemagglutinin repeat-containing protein [Pseudomonas sp. nanlin1]|uniref:hemagglutinin repeat-containing protein n=1 Tax=Pseudomonas sp. nanlin1 TaxID=3040605 RepID=UPI00388E8A4C
MHRPSPLFAINPLRWAISVALLSPSLACAADALQAAPGPGGTAQIGATNGVPIVNIVAPVDGLSHNMFLQYNVDKAGVVLNNALQPGYSQLAGQLEANPQFHGQAANLILNQVIGQDLSRVNGPQEIVGRPADYILANPNGFSINGGTAINATHSLFLVGTPELSEGRLTHLNTRDAAGMLEIGAEGLRNPGGALSLITPYIDKRGPANSSGETQLILGQQRVAYADLSVSDIKPSSAVLPPQDAKLFGAMRANRIRIISTTEGAGVRLPGSQLESRHGVRIEARGDIIQTASDGAGTRIAKAFMKGGSRDVELLSSANVHLSGTSIDGRQVRVKAGKDLIIDGVTQKSVQQKNDNWSKSAWFIPTEEYAKDRTQTDTRVTGSRLHGREGVELEAGGGGRLLGSTLTSEGPFSVKTGADLDIVAATGRTEVVETVNHRKHLWRRDSSDRQIQETVEPSKVEGQSLNLQIGGRYKQLGSSVKSTGDAQLKAKNGVLIDSTDLVDESHFDSAGGDLVKQTFFGKREKTDESGTTRHGSELLVDGKLEVRSDNLVIKGSKVMGKEDALVISERGNLVVEGVEAQRNSSSDRAHNKFAWIFTDQSSKEQQQTRQHPSQVASQTNLRLTSPQTVAIRGSAASAQGQLAVQAGQGIEVRPSSDDTRIDTQARQADFNALARETKQAQDGKDGSKQWEAGVNFAVSHQASQQSQRTLNPSSLEGASVTLAGGDKVILDSAKVTATQGNVEMSGARIELLAGREAQQTKEQTSTASGGLNVTAGIDRLGSALNGRYQASAESDTRSSAKPTQISAKQQVTLSAETLVNEAAHISGANTTTIKARDVDNRAVADTRSTRHDSQDTSVSLGFSGEYTDLTRPIQKVVQGRDQSRFQQPNVEDALAAPSLGGDLSVAHVGRATGQDTSTAKVAEIKGGTLAVDVENTLSDTGTRYTADTGAVQIHAGQHLLKAAENTESSRLERVEADTNLRVDTNTGSDINAKIVGSGGSQHKVQSSSTAVVGSLSGKTGIQVQLGTDGRYEGTAFKTTEGPIQVQAQGKLDFVQANNRQQQREQTITGSAWAKGGTSPAAGKSMGGSAIGAYERSHREDSQAVVGQFQTPGDVSLTGKKGVRLEGSHIGAPTEKAGNVHLGSADGRVEVLAATDTHQADGARYGGGLQASFSRNAAQGSQGQGAGLGGHVEWGQTDEASRTLKGAQWHNSGSTRLASGASHAEAIHVQGLQANGGDLQLDASQGGTLVEAAQSTERRNNKAVAVGLGLNGSSHEDPSKSASAVYGRAKLDLDQLNSITHEVSRLRAEQVGLNSRLETQLSGVQIDAQRIAGQIGGDLLVSSPRDQVNGVKVSVDGKLSGEQNPSGLLNGASALAGPLGGKLKEKAGEQIKRLDTGLTPSVNLEVAKFDRDTAGQTSHLRGRDAIVLNVDGATRLVGAQLKSSQGQVDLGGSPAQQSTLSGTDYRAEAGIDLSNAPKDLIESLLNAAGRPKSDNASSDLGLIRTGGFNNSQRLEATIEAKQP